MRAPQLIYLLAFGLFAAPPLLAQNTITTVVGGGNPSGPATAADIVTPSGVAVDSQGNVYIGQFLGSQVFKVNPQGIISVFAGQNFFGGTGDGGPALNALFRQPVRVAVDSGGNVFIADFGNSRIRRIDAHTGIITTVAGNGSTCPDRTQSCGDGGAATQATLTLPEAVAIDSAGDLFIADRLDHRIRRVDATSGIITTVAGNGTQCISGPCGDGGPATQANLNNPRGIAVDPSGNLFIGEAGRIRRVDAASHIITTLVTPPDGANYLIVEPTGTLLVSGNLSVYRVNVSTTAVTSLAGAGTSCVGFDSGDGGPATAACLGRPFSVAEDSTGVIYVGQFSSNLVRKIDASAQHIITTFAGGGAGGDGGPARSAILGFPSGGALDSEGNGYINDSANNRIRRVDGVTGTITTVAGNNSGVPGSSGDGGPAVNASLGLNPNNGGTVVDPSGNIFLSDVDSEAVRRVDAVTGVITSFAGGAVCADPTTPCGDGGAATSAAMNFPGGLALDQNRNLFITDTNDSRVRRVAASTGVISTAAGSGTSCPDPVTGCGDGGLATAADLNAPASVAVDGSGNLFIADTNDFRVRRVDALTGIITSIAGNGTQCTSAVTPCGDGGLATAAGLYLPEGITVDSSGNVFIGDNNLVRRVDAATKTITTIAGSPARTSGGDGGPALAAGISFAAGLWVDAVRTLFIADAENNRIRQVSLSPAAAITGTIANFGSQIVGVQSPAHTVTITNTGAATLLIAGITVSGTGFSSTNTCTNTNNQLAPSQSCTASVTFTAPSAGLFAGTLTISTNDPTASQNNFTFGGTGSTSALASIAVGPANPSIVQGLPQQFTATATYANASTQDLTNSAVWTTASSAIATINNAGQATGVAPGTTAVHASSGSLTASTNLTVTAPTLLGLSLTPTTSFIIVGQTEQFKALAIFNNGTEQDVTNSATWTSSSPANATITAAGLATGVALGNTTIKAVDGAVSATAPLTVTPAGFTVTGSMNISREFHTATLLNNGKVLIAGGEDSESNALNSAELYDPATGTFSFTGSMNFARVFQSAVLLNNGKVLIVGGAVTGGGLAELYDPATGTFSLTGSTTDAFILAGTATLLKNGKVLVLGGEGSSGFLASAELYDPATGLFTATGSLSTGREFPTSTLLENGQVLVVGGENSSGPVPTAELYNPTTGTFTLTAGNPITAQTFFLESSGTLLNTGMVLLPSDVASSALELYNPATQVFSSTGTSTSIPFFDDVATLLNNGTVLLAGGDTGTDFNGAEIYDPISATTTPTGQLNVGRVFSTATLLNNGKVLVTGGENLTGLIAQSAAELYTPSSLTPANLLSIAVTPALPTISVGSAEQFVATGTFVGNTTQVLNAVHWTSSVPAVASITNGTGNGGAAFGLSAGSTIVTACAGSACGSTTLTVGSGTPTLASITVGPANPTIPKGTTQQFAATGHFSDGSSSTLTNVTWSSGTLAVASISSAGLATALSVGTSTITAASGGIHGSTVLTVSAPILVSITVTPANASLVAGLTQQFTAAGKFSDGSTQTLVASTVGWASTVPAAATINAAGLATAVSAGTTKISAISGAITGSTNFTVTPPGVPEPAIGLNPGSLTFATQLITTSSAPQTITVSNSGTAGLTINSIALTGTNPAEFKETNTCPVPPAVLPAGQTCTVQVSFVPLAVGTRTANVTFTDNSGGIPGSAQNVPVSGSATAPAPITTTTQLSYPVGTNVSETATINCPSNTVPCTDPNAHSLKLVVSQVLTPFTLTVTSFEVPVSQADGVCPAGATETTDFDCRFKSTFTLQTEPNGDVIVPQCIPFSNGNCVFYRISNVPPTSSYVGPVFENFSWNNNAFVPSSFYAANNPRLFDDPDAPPFDVNHQFVFDITDFFESNGNKVGVDPTIHGHTKQYNDFVVAFTAALPSPPLTLTFQAPLGTGSPSFQQGATIPVAFTLKQGTTVITNAVTSPNAVSIGLANASGARLPALAPDGSPAAFTFNTGSQQYVLSLATQALPPGVYTLFINSNLFVQQSTAFTIAASSPVVIILAAANPTITKGTGTYVVPLTVMNHGNVSVGTLSLTKATLGGQAALSFSGPDSNVMPGANATFTLTFPSSAGADGKGVPLIVNGNYFAGSLSGTWTVGFRSVTLP